MDFHRHSSHAPVRPPYEQGNVFLFIMLGVALFAALGFTMSRTMSTDTTGMMSERDAVLAASEIVDYAQQIERATSRLRRKGCSENEISYQKPVAEGADAGHTNPDSPGDFSCHIFHSAGGRVQYKRPVDAWLIDGTVAPYTDVYTFSTANQIIGVGGAGPELLFRLHGVHDALCRVVNQQFDIPDIPSVGNAYEEDGRYKGDFTGGGNLTTAALDGHYTGCFSTTESSGYNVVYSVLIEK